MPKMMHWLFWAGATLVLSASACRNDDKDDSSDGTNDRPEQTGAACDTASDCYPELDHETLQGEARCLDRVPDGYCTHLCESDADCCAAEGECPDNLRQVCSPFESTGLNLCFLSCEDADLTTGGGAGAPGRYADANEYCRENAHVTFICRSSGGGSQNRKVCVPGGCGDATLTAAYADCSQSADQATCEDLGGSWVTSGADADRCYCPTGQEACDCTSDAQCLGVCVAPVPDSGGCETVTTGLCSAATRPSGAWCVFTADGVAEEQDFG